MSPARPGRGRPGFLPAPTVWGTRAAWGWRGEGRKGLEARPAGPAPADPPRAREPAEPGGRVPPAHGAGQGPGPRKSSPRTSSAGRAGPGAPEPSRPRRAAVPQPRAPPGAPIPGSLQLVRRAGPPGRMTRAAGGGGPRAPRAPGTRRGRGCALAPGARPSRPERLPRQRTCQRARVGGGALALGQ